MQRTLIHLRQERQFVLVHVDKYDSRMLFLYLFLNTFADGSLLSSRDKLFQLLGMEYDGKSLRRVLFTFSSWIPSVLSKLVSFLKWLLKEAGSFLCAKLCMNMISLYFVKSWILSILCSEKRLLVCDNFLALDIYLTAFFCRWYIPFKSGIDAFPQACIPYSMCDLKSN